MGWISGREDIECAETLLPKLLHAVFNRSKHFASFTSLTYGSGEGSTDCML